MVDGSATEIIEKQENCLNICSNYDIIIVEQSCTGW